MDLISKDELIRRITEHGTLDMGQILDIIEDMPAANQSQWEERPINGKTYYECLKCGYIANFPVSYCPSCCYKMVNCNEN